MKTLQHSDYTMWWFRANFNIRWRYAPQQIAVPSAVCIWGDFGEIALTSQASKLDDLRQHRNISCNAKQFNVQLERLMFCTAIQRNATPFVCTLYHSTLRWAISRNATLFVFALWWSTRRQAISRNATPYVCTLNHLTLRRAIWRNATPFVYCVAN